MFLEYKISDKIEIINYLHYHTNYNIYIKKPSIETDDFTNIVKYFKNVIETVSVMNNTINYLEFYKSNKYYKSYNFYSLLKNYSNYIKNNILDFKLNFYSDINLDIEEYLIIPYQYFTNLIKSLFYYKLYSGDSFMLYENYINNCVNDSYPTYEIYLDYITKYYNKNCNNLLSSITDIGNYCNFLCYYLEHILDITCLSNVLYINLYDDSYLIKNISINLIIVKYFEFDNRVNRLINIFSKIFNINKTSVVTTDYNNYYIDYINNYIIPHTNNLIICVDSEISTLFYEKFEYICEKKTILLSNKHNYFTKKYLNNDEEYETFYCINNYNGLISSYTLKYNDFLLDNVYLDYFKYGISFVIRFYNEEKKLKLVVDKLKQINNLDYEILLIDNNSNDKSTYIAKELAEKYSNVKYLKYDIRNARPGIENEQFVKSGKKNLLSTFYNWCFKQCNYSYCFKWDADMLVNINNITNFLNSIDLKKKYMCYSSNGNNLYVNTNNNILVDRDKSSNEFRFFYRNMFFIHCISCESYVIDEFINVNSKINLFDEIKYVDDDFFDKRSSAIDHRDEYFLKTIQNLENSQFSNLTINNVYTSEQNILICNCNFNVFGGAEKVSFQIANYEIMKGKNVYFAQENYEDCDLNIMLDKLNLNKFTNSIDTTKVFYLSLSMEDAIEFAYKNNLLIIINNCYLWSWKIRELIISKNIKFCVITHTHLGWLNEYIRDMYKNIKYVLCVNNITKSILKKNSIDVKTLILHHYCNPYDKQFNKLNKLNIIYSGRISIEKGIHNLGYICLNLLKFTNNFIINIVGSGDEKILDELQRFIKQHQIENYFIFHGYMNDPSPILKECDILILPSICSEGLPFVICEALSYGIMCISTDTPSLREILDFEDNTLVKLESYDILHKDKFIYTDYNEMYEKSLECVDEYSYNFAKTIYNAYISDQYIDGVELRKQKILSQFNLKQFCDTVDNLFML